MAFRLPRLALYIVLSGALSLPGARAASAGDETPPLTHTEVRDELRELNRAVTALLQIVDAWRQESREVEALKAVSELDRAIAFLDGERRRLVAERDEVEQQAEDLRQAVDEARRRAGNESSFQEQLMELQGLDPEEHLEGQELLLRRYLQRLDHLDARIQEVDASLQERRAWRQALVRPPS